MKFNTILLVILLGFTLFTKNLEAATLQSLNQNNTSLVPLRTISEELGAKVEFNKENQKITVSYKDSTVEVIVGSKSAIVNGSKKELQVKPQVVKGTTYVPIRFIGEALGAVVDYQKGTLKISLDNQIKEWKLATISNSVSPTNPPVSANTFNSGTKIVDGKKITYLTINMNDSKVKTKIATSNNTVAQAQALKR